MSKEHAYAYESGYQDGLRCAETENAKLVTELREQIRWLKKGDLLHVLTDQEYIDQCERERLMQVSIDALDKKNAELCELVRDMWHQSCTYDTTCEGCPMYVKHWDGTEECEFETRIIKLGIEVGYEW
jgi:hypothetical protein